MKWKTRNSAVGRGLALLTVQLGFLGVLPSEWILHHKKNQEGFVSIKDILEYISQIDHVFCPSMSVISGYKFKRNSGKRKWMVVQKRGKGVRDVALQKLGRREGFAQKKWGVKSCQSLERLTLQAQQSENKHKHGDLCIPSLWHQVNYVGCKE